MPAVPVARQRVSVVRAARRARSRRPTRGPRAALPRHREHGEAAVERVDLRVPLARSTSAARAPSPPAAAQAASTTGRECHAAGARANAGNRAGTYERAVFPRSIRTDAAAAAEGLTPPPRPQRRAPQPLRCNAFGDVCLGQRPEVDLGLAHREGPRGDDQGHQRLGGRTAAEPREVALHPARHARGGITLQHPPRRLAPRPEPPRGVHALEAAAVGAREVPEGVVGGGAPGHGVEELAA